MLNTVLLLNAVLVSFLALVGLASFVACKIDEISWIQMRRELDDVEWEGPNLLTHLLSLTDVKIVIGQALSWSDSWEGEGFIPTTQEVEEYEELELTNDIVDGLEDARIKGLIPQVRAEDSCLRFRRAPGSVHRTYGKTSEGFEVVVSKWTQWHSVGNTKAKRTWRYRGAKSDHQTLRG